MKPAERPTINPDMELLDAVSFAAVEEANARLRELTDGFVEWALSEIRQALGVLDGMIGDGVCDPAGRARVFDVLHNLKGQGGTFDFHIVTRVCGVGCDLIRDQTPVSLSALEKVQACCKVAEFALLHGFTGAGGERGRELLGKLEAVVADPAA